jgi:hypothetical protein
LNLGLWPDVVPFPLANGAASPVLEDLIGGPAAALTAVALVAAPEARASGWARHAAIALATQWRGSRRVVLADLDLEQPSLHEDVGVPNDEGVVDLIDYGLSLARLVHPAGDAGYDLLPAGLFAPDPGHILRHDGWTRVLLDVADRRATLLAFVPAEADGADAVVERAGAVLVLAEEHEAARTVESLPHPYAVLAILTPEAVVADETPEAEAAAGAGAIAAPDGGEPTASHEIEPPPDVLAAAEAAATDGTSSERADTAVASPEDAAAASVTSSVDVDDAATESVDRPIRTHADTAGSETPPPLVGGARLSDEEFDRIRLPTDGASRAALIADLRERQRTARLAGEAGELSGARTVPSDTGADRLEPPAVPLVVPSIGGAVTRELEMEARADDVELEAITPPGRTSARRTPDGYRRPLIWTLAVVLLVSALAGAWRYLSGRLPRASEVVAAPEPVPEPTGPTYADDALPYVVAIEAHRDLPTAVERVTDLREIEPELAFHIEPLERDGVVFYHVMAGPVPDSTLALALRDTLIARGHKTGRTPTDVRATPFTYLVGEYSTEDDAQEQSDILRRLDIPGYVLRAAAADGEPVFRLYVGGFGSEAEAGAIGQMLRAAGIRDTLVTRTGAMSYGALLSAPDATDRDSTATDSITP